MEGPQYSDSPHYRKLTPAAATDNKSYLHFALLVYPRESWLQALTSSERLNQMQRYKLTCLFLILGVISLMTACSVPRDFISPLPVSTATSPPVQTSLVSPLAEPTSTSPLISAAIPTNELDTTEWVLTSLRGELMEDASITLEFHSQNELHGKMICNGYGSRYRTIGSNFMLTQDMARSRFACDLPDDESQLEDTYLETLAEAVAYQMEGDRLTFQDASGETILVFSLKQALPVDPNLAGVADVPAQP